ncbi:MAG: hypothetical protein COA85_11940 [Robiginitomaculum sp.]|nr:MAG: hypothetical protein COA85_11940 [Robiginitomaculum sp.]
MTIKAGKKTMLAKATLMIVAAAGELALVLPASGQTVVTTIKVEAPRREYSVTLGPTDPPATFISGTKNPWFCNQGISGKKGTVRVSNGLEDHNSATDGDVFDLWEREQSYLEEVYDGDLESIRTDRREQYENLERAIRPYLDSESKSPLEFWNSNAYFENKPFNFSAEPVSTLVLNPSPGSSESRTIMHCYTMKELADNKREVIRWAKYMKNIWLPAHKPEKKQ